MADYIPVGSESAAIESALQLSGLLRRRGIRAERVSLRDDRTPFVAGQIRALERGWKVTVPQLSWNLPSAISGYRDSHARDVAIVLAEQTGQLIRIDADAPVVDSDMRPLPAGELAEQRMRGASELHLALPTEQPGITFNAALDAILSHGIGSPYKAKSINAVYVLHAKAGQAPRKVWSVTLRGLPPIRPKVPKGGRVPPVHKLNHMRNVVDATTGRVLFATSVPQPG